MQENHRKLVVLALMSALAGVTGHAHAQCVTDADCSDPNTYCRGSFDGGGSSGGSSSSSGTSGGSANGSGGTSGSTGGSSSNSGGIGSGTTATSGGDPGSDPAADQAAPLVPPSTCLLAPEYWCKSDADCAESQRCELHDRFGACVTNETTCVTDADCATGLVCAESWGGGSTGGDPGSNTGSVGSSGSSGGANSGTSGGSTTGGANGVSTSGGGAAEPLVSVCNPYPPTCATSEDCDAGFECVVDAAGGSNSTGGSDDGVSEPPVFKVCEVERLDCDSDADCSADWKCVALDNRSGRLQSPARWGAAGAIKNCYPEGLAALAETVYGLPTAPRLDAQYPGNGGGGTDNGGENGPTDPNGGGSGGDSSGNGENNGSGTGAEGGPSSAGGASNTGDAQNGTGGTPDTDDCSAAHGLSTSTSSLIMLALGSLLARRRRRA